MSAVTRSTVSRDGSGRGGRRSGRLAGHLALAGASLGVLAGLLELAIGPSIRDWVGNKQDTTRLGLTTVVLSVVGLAAVRTLRRSEDHRVAIAVGLLLPALICFTTVGRLWYVPGALLLAAGILVLAGTPRQEFRAALSEQHWRTGLLVLCGTYYVFLGATALGVAGALGILGGLLVWAAARAAPKSPRVAYALLLGGAMPFATATWWSVITPVIAVMTIVIGRGVIRHAEPIARVTQPRRASETGAIA